MNTTELIQEIQAVSQSQRKFRNEKSPIEARFNEIEDKLGINYWQLTSKDRAYDIVAARHIMMYLMRKQDSMTLKAIGKVFNRDHSSIIHAVTRIQDAQAAREFRLIPKLKLFGIC